MLASAAFRALTPTAIGVLLLFHAAYDPNKELFVSHAQAREHLRVSPNTLTAAYRELEAAGFLVKRREAIRPGGMGSAGRGKATVYDLPERSLSGPCAWRHPDDPGRTGRWRIYSGRLRDRLKKLSPAAVKIWCHMHAIDRQMNGAPVFNPPRALTPDEVGFPAETLRRKIIELCAANIIRVAEKGAGSRPTTYELTEAECKALKASLAADELPPATVVGA